MDTIYIIDIMDIMDTRDIIDIMNIMDIIDIRNITDIINTWDLNFCGILMHPLHSCPALQSICLLGTTLLSVFFFY